ncbi:MAG: protease modulator HflC, partial [Dehalococcoidia bacterium]|nr:protease modulator HflC [Dehalococcoidia bacterium]
MKALVAVILFIVAWVLVGQTTFVVDVKEQAIVLQFGEYVKTVKEPGLYLKAPFAQSVATFDKRVLLSDTPPGEYLELDKKRLVVDNITRWRIGDPLEFYKSVRSEAGALARVQPIVFSELRDELALRPMDAIIGMEREDIMDRVARRVQTKVAPFGIEIVDVRIMRVDLPVEVQESVFARMKAERERLGKGFRAEGEEAAAILRAEADKQVTILSAEGYQQSQRLRGEGDAQATAIYAGSFQRDPEFYGFLR